MAEEELPVNEVETTKAEATPCQAEETPVAPEAVEEEAPCETEECPEEPPCGEPEANA